MCGLFGVAGKITTREVAVFNHMMIASYVRGVHSVGVGLVNNEQEIEVIKKLGPPWEMMDSRRYQQSIITPNSLKVILGHTRHATKGAVNIANAHPFQFEGFVGAHNGTIDNALSTFSEYRVGDNDSFYLLQSIAEKGVRETIPNCQGAWALTWFQGDSLFFLKNAMRPFIFAFANNFETVIWASQRNILEYAINEEHVLLNPSTTEKACFLAPSDDILLEINLSQNQLAYKNNGEIKGKQKEEVEGLLPFHAKYYNKYCNPPKKEDDLPNKKPEKAYEGYATKKKVKGNDVVFCDFCGDSIYDEFFSTKTQHIVCLDCGATPGGRAYWGLPIEDIGKDVDTKRIQRANDARERSKDFQQKLN